MVRVEGRSVESKGLGRSASSGREGAGCEHGVSIRFCLRKSVGKMRRKIYSGKDGDGLICGSFIPWS